MYCPQCGTDSASSVQYCRACGANLKVIGKAVALSEAIARSDRGPLPKIREMVKNLKVDQVTEEVSGALERMNNEIAQVTKKESKERRALINFPRKKTPEERREGHITKGIVSLFSGAGLTLFLYYLSAALVLKLPPHVIADIPFEIDPVVRVIWLLGLIPTLSGLGHIVSGLLIRPKRHELHQTERPAIDEVEFPRTTGAATSAIDSTPRSVTEHTTELLREKTIQ
jgi:hypothetical protein